MKIYILPIKLESIHCRDSLSPALQLNGGGKCLHRFGIIWATFSLLGQLINCLNRILRCIGNISIVERRSICFQIYNVLHFRICKTVHGE